MTRAEPRRQRSAQAFTSRRQTQAAVNATSAAPDHGQRDESAPPSSRADSGRRRHSQAAANAGRRAQCTAHLPGKLRTACRERAPIEPRRQRSPQAFTSRRHSQAAVNAAAGVRNAQRICSANRGQRSDNVPPSSRTAAVAAGIRKPQPIRAGARNTQRICSANCGQRAPIEPHSSSRRRHSQAAANTGRRAQCTAHLPGKSRTAQR